MISVSVLYCLILYYFYVWGFFYHICVHVQLVYCVTIDWLYQIYSYDVLYVLFQCALRTDESEISYVCKKKKNFLSGLSS